MASSTLARIAVPSRLGAAGAPMGENWGVSANPTVLVVQHDLDSPLAALAPPLAALGVRTVTWFALSEPEPPAGSFDGVIVLGGIANPDGTGRRRAARARARDRGRCARARTARARHLPRRPGDRTGARRERASACPRSSSDGCRPASTRPARDDPLLAGCPARARRPGMAQLRVPPAGRLGAPRAQRRVRAGLPRRRHHLGTAVPRRGDASGTRGMVRGGRRTSSTSAALPAEVVIGTDEQRADQLRLAARIVGSFRPRGARGRDSGLAAAARRRRCSGTGLRERRRARSGPRRRPPRPCVWTASFAKMFSRCDLTVSGEIQSSAATSAFSFPG